MTNNYLLSIKITRKGSGLAPKHSELPGDIFLMRTPPVSFKIGVGVGVGVGAGIGIENERWQELTKILTPTPIESGVGIESNKPG
jgi:hypothetical protein